MMSSLKRILVVHPFGIGDFLFVTPVLRALRLIPTVERVDLLLGSRTESVVRKNPHVDDIFVIDKDRFHSQSFKKTAGDLLTLGNTLRKRKYDLMLDYSLRDEYSFWGRFFLGISRVAGFQYKKRGFWLDRKVSLPQGFCGKHASTFYCDVAVSAGIPVDRHLMEFYLDAGDRLEALKRLEEQNITANSFLAVSPGGGESWGKDADFKRWPVEFYADFTEKLCRQTGISNVLIFGSPGESALCHQLQQRLKIRAFDFSGKVNLVQAAALAAKAKLFIGNDGGLVHVAHALRVPVIAFYGPVDPVVYGPVAPGESPAVVIYKKDLDCRPCYKNFRYRSECSTRECLQHLDVQEALNQVGQSGILSKLDKRSEE